ncbi:MAG: adenine phosphoribosyltransferase [Fibrobacteria bacterium]|nr:adenine phosphoribosyltransferase [Fibrobacteria bacterium]
MVELSNVIRNIPDWPKPGIQFKDITTLLSNAEALGACIQGLTAPWKDKGVDLVLGTEARGFLFAPAVAVALGAGCVLARKPGKLPGSSIREEYALEYGTDGLEVHDDCIRPGQNVLLVDDLLATGGTILAASNLVRRLGGNVVGYSFVIELGFLPGRSRLEPLPVHSLVTYSSEN